MENKKPVGRPVTRNSQRKDVMLSRETLDFFEEQKRRDPAFNVSAYIEEAIREKRLRDSEQDEFFTMLKTHGKTS